MEVLAEGYAQTQSERIAERQEELAWVERDLSVENSPEEEQALENQEGEVAENLPDVELSQMVLPVTFVSWAEAGLEDHMMDWQDENLEAAMRQVTGIIDRDIMLSDVWELTELDLGSDQISNISTLSDLTNLTRLRLYDNQISDISGLRSLTNLTWLDLNTNQISDIRALSGLTNLAKLYLYSNPIKDYSPVEFIEQNGGNIDK